MKALVVYESLFGNTRAVAEAVATGIADRMPVELVEVGSAPATLGDDVGLLVVGGPTHAFGLTRPATRSDAAKQAVRPVVSEGRGLREWLADLRCGERTVAFAAFDTHIDKRVPGSAARSAHRRLRRLGLDALADPESFYVSDVQGPLLPGETDRARTWGEQLPAALTVRG